MSIEICLLTPADAAEFLALRQEALTTAPQAFWASPGDEKEVDLESVRERLAPSGNSAVFGARGEGLVGMAGVRRMERPKLAHKAHIWGMYVRTSHRGKGIARRLLRTAVGHAERWPGVDAVHLSAAETAAEAISLYESCGFRIWGTEPDAIRVGGRRLSEHHMVRPVLR